MKNLDVKALARENSVKTIRFIMYLPANEVTVKNEKLKAHQAVVAFCVHRLLDASRVENPFTE